MDSPSEVKLLHENTTNNNHIVEAVEQVEGEIMHEYNIYNKLCAIKKYSRRRTPVHCVLCGKEFKQTLYYENHMIHFHNKVDYPRIFKCDHCPRKFKFKHHMRSHMRKHDGSKRFPCKHCREKFVTKKSRRAHIVEAHIRSNIYQCCKCTNVFHSRSTLHSHMKDIHEIDPKTHTCNKCFALCEYKRVAFVKPARKRIVNFSETISTHDELCDMIQTRQCGDIIKIDNEDKEVIDGVPPGMKNNDVRTVRRSIKKFFCLLNNASISEKHSGSDVTAGRFTMQGSASDILIDSVVSLSNDPYNIFEKDLVIKLERIDSTPYINREYVEELTEVKSEPLESQSNTLYNSEIYDDDILSDSNQCLWSEPDTNHEQLHFDDFDIVKTNVSTENTYSPITNNENNLISGVIEDITSIFQCRYCTSKFTTKRSLAKHVDKKHFSVLLRYKCKECHQILNSKPSLIKHMTQMHTSKKYPLKHNCMYCIESFKLEIQLNQHVKKFHKDLIKCSKCHILFNNLFALKRHMKFKHNDSSLYKCQICDVIFPYENQLLQHNSDNGLLLECHNCHNKFERTSIIRRIKTKRSKNIFHRCKVCSVISHIKLCKDKYVTNNLRPSKSSVKNNQFKCISKTPKRKHQVKNMKPLIPRENFMVSNQEHSDSSRETSNEISDSVLPPVYSESQIPNLESPVPNFKSSVANLDSSISNSESPIIVSNSSVSEVKSLETCKSSTISRRPSNVKDTLESPVQNEGTEVYICQSCKSLYLSNENFLKEIQQKNIELPREVIGNERNVSSHICIICNATLHVDIDRHDRVMNLNKPIEVEMFECVVCNCLFSMRTKVMDHMRSTHQAYLQSHRCVVCDIIFKDPETLESHQQRKHNANIEDNVTLNESDTSESSTIDSQMRLIRINVAPRVDDYIDFSKLLKCDHCRALFQLKSSLQSHIQLEHMPKVTLHKCCICCTVFYRITDLDRHLRNKHQLDMELYSGHKDPTNFNLKWKKILTHTYEIEKM